MKKIAVIILGILMAGSAILSVAPVNAAKLEDATFNVQQFLKLPYDSNGNQDSAYFSETAKNPPIFEFILNMITFALKIIGSIAVLLLIVAGIRMMMAQGNQQRIENARKMLTSVALGLMLTFSAYIIIIFIQAVILPPGGTT